MGQTTTEAISAPSAANFISILALGLIWGGTFMVVTIALRGFDPVTLATARLVLGAFALTVLAWGLGRPVPRLDPILLCFVAAIGVASGALPFFLLAWGQQYVPSAFAGLSMAVLPLFVLPLAHVFVPGDRMTWRKTGGFALGLVGALILLGPGAMAAGQGNAGALGQLACIAASLCYACSSILTRRCPPIDPIWLSALSLVVGALIMAPIMLWHVGVPGTAPAPILLAVLGLGLIPTALATLLRVFVIRSAGPSFMTLVNYQVPVWAMLFGALILSETLPGRFFVALALILCGLAVSQWPTLRGLLSGPKTR